MEALYVSHDFDAAYFPFFSNFVQVSLRFTVRLNTGFAGVESRSTQK